SVPGSHRRFPVGSGGIGGLSHVRGRSFALRVTGPVTAAGGVDRLPLMPCRSERVGLQFPCPGGVLHHAGVLDPAAAITGEDVRRAPKASGTKSPSGATSTGSIQETSARNSARQENNVSVSRSGRCARSGAPWLIPLAPAPAASTP